jgi:hypothetical protein
MAEKHWDFKIVLISFALAFLILFRSPYLSDTDPYLHLSVAKHVSTNGFTPKVPFIEIQGGTNFNYVSEKWLFIYLISFFYKIPLSDIFLAKLFIALIFSSIISIIGKILKQLGTTPKYSLFIFALPFQVLLKLRPEPLGLLFMLTLFWILLTEVKINKKILFASFLILIHSQIHAFFVADFLILLLYALVYKEPRVFISVITLIPAYLLNPYKAVWLKSLYKETFPRLHFTSSLMPSELMSLSLLEMLFFALSSLMPSELMSLSLLEMLFFALLFSIALYKLRAWDSKAKRFLFLSTAVSLLSGAFFLRSISYSTALFSIVIGLLYAGFPHKHFRIILLSLAVMNPLITLFNPNLMLPGYDEHLQIEVIKNLRPDDLVLSQWDLSPYVIYYSGAKVVTAKDYEKFFSGKHDLAKKFNATALYFDKKRFRNLDNNLKRDEEFELIGENERFVAYRID